VAHLRGLLSNASRSSRVAWGMFAVFLVVPLYALAVIVLLKSGLLRSDGLNDEQYKAMWTFIASGLAATATVLAALLTKSQNDRAAAYLAESDARKTSLETEGLARQRLETVVSSLGLMSNNGAYAPKPVLAGALSTLVELGHPPIASRALSAALDDGAIDTATTAWLLDSMLRSKDATLREEAAAQLSVYAATLTSVPPRTFDWPHSLTASWPSKLSPNAGRNCIDALIDLLLSKDPDWWRNGWSWIGYTLDEAMLRDEHAITKGNAAVVFIALEPFLSDGWVQGFNDGRKSDDVLERARAIQEEAAGGFRLDDIAAWGST
jgi:hypothetical protein